MRVLFGGDPEILLRRGGDVFPCIGLVPGTKRNPFPVPDSRCGLALQEDGVALELGFTPVRSWEFRNQIRLAWDEALRYVRANLGRDVAFNNRPYHEFTPEQLVSPQAQTLGCDPDRLAYDGGMLRPPPSLEDIGNSRFAGGHIHVGYDKEATPIPETAIVQFMDLGHLPDIESMRDMQQGRRKFYGLAGLYRKKDYGLEYRTLSNFWLLHHSNSASYIASVAEAAINKPSLARSIWKQVPWELVQKSINEEKICIPMGDVYNWIDQLVNAPNEIEDDLEEIEEPPVEIHHLDEGDFIDASYYDDEEEEAA